MSSSASKPRTISPFRFHKPASVNGKLPGQSPVPTASFGSSSVSRTPSIGGRSATPGRGRALPPPNPPTPQKLQLSSNSSVGSASPNTPTPTSERVDHFGSATRPKENVTVTVRFRPLSTREIQKGDEVAWYADGDTTVRSEYNAATCYAFDRVFGPATTTRHVYDAAAQHVVSGAMEGVNGTVFAYGVTSSGKTHTMHGDQKSPGIIPLAVKDVFSIIQETPGREFLLRVSYLEIYNEVINDLLDPAGQNLRVREDAQGTYVEGIKEEVVLSPAHCLSLIATGEEHRHVGSNNFNLLSSRSHTIFTLTIESSPRGDFSDEEVTLSQLNLIDLAGSESSKTETTGLRRKEGSYINKSLLTLGTVISKLTDGKATHIPYRDSKLTRLLQSSLSGHGRVSLICTVTPASTSNEETHNTLKFAHRAKHVEIHASQNKIMDEKSLIKKYQKEIMSLKRELEQVKKGIADNTYLMGNQEDLASLKQQLEAGQVKLQSRLEEEEQAKAALLGRIQRLTKLILVSTKNTVPSSLPVERQGNRRRHSFGEEELAYLPDRRRDYIFEDEDGLESELSLDGRSDNIITDDLFKGEKKTKRRSMLAWFKLKKNEHLGSAASLESDNSSNASPATSGSAVAQMDPSVDLKGRRKSVSRRVDEVAPVDPFFEPTQAGELFSATVRGRRPPPTGTTMADQMDLLREQVKMLGGEVALCSSSLKRLTEQAAANPDDAQLQMQIKNMKDEISEKKRQMRLLERRIVGNGEATPNNVAALELSQTISKLTTQLNEKSFELEIKSADNRILQEQLQAKVNENTELQSTIAALRQQIAEKGDNLSQQSFMDAHSETSCKSNTACQVNEDAALNSSMSGEFRHVAGAERDVIGTLSLQPQILQQAMEIEKLRQEKDQLLEEKDALQIQSCKLAEESSYAKELASAAAVELKNLAEEVTKLSYQNSKLAAELATAQELAYARAGQKSVGRQRLGSNNSRRLEEEAIAEDLRRELLASKEREAALEVGLAERELRDAEIRKKLEEAKRREADLENDLAGMWVLVAKLRKGRANNDGMVDSQDLSGLSEGLINTEDDIKHGNGSEFLSENMDVSALRKALENERHHTGELEMLVSQLKSDDLNGLDLAALEDLSALHVEALTRLCHAKASMQQKLEKDKVNGTITQVREHIEEDKSGHVCKVCFEAPTAAVLLPCRHFSLCKSCAVACTECPLCRTIIEDRIITFTS